MIPGRSTPACALRLLLCAGSALLGAAWFGCALDERDVSPADAVGGDSAVASSERNGADAGAFGGASSDPARGGTSSGASNAGGADPSGIDPGSGGTSNTAGVAGATGSGGTSVVGNPGCFEQLLQNPDFDLGHVSWTEVSEVRDVIVHRDNTALLGAGVSPQSGDFLAWFGGIPNGDFGEKYATTLAQRVQIPAETTSLVMTGYVWVAQPTLGSMPFDWVVMELLDTTVSDGTYRGQWQVETWGDADAVQPGWVYFEAVTEMLDLIAGLPRDLSVDSRPDGGGSLNLWLDSLRLEARCPR